MVWPCFRQEKDEEKERATRARVDEQCMQLDAVFFRRGFGGSGRTGLP